MKLKNLILRVIGGVAATLCLLQAQVNAAPIRVVTSTPDLKDMVENVCGEDVRVKSLMVGTENHHAVPMKPSFLRLLADCDVLVVNGLEYEHAFLPGALMSINKQTIQQGASHYIDTSQYIKPGEVPDKVDLSLGDLHPLGASHIHIEPGNGILMTKTIYEKMSTLYPDRAERWRPRFEAYVRKIYGKLEELREYCKGTEGIKMIFYHPGWCYLTERFGWNLVGYVEVRAGIEPTPSHLQQLIEMMKGRGCKLICPEMCYSPRIPDYLAKQVGAKVFKIPHHTKSLPGCDTYLEFLDVLIKGIADAGREVYGLPKASPPATASQSSAAGPQR